MRKFVINLSVCVLFVFCFIAVLLSLCGCKPESPEARLAWGIQVYNVDSASYNRITLNDYGGPARCETDFVACFVYADGSRIEQGGLRFTETASGANYYVRPESGGGYWVETDKAGTASTYVTNGSGMSRFTNWCTLWGVLQTESSAYAKGRRTEPALVSRAGYSNRYDSLTGKLILWYGQDSQYPSIKGGHYQSGGYSHFSTLLHDDTIAVLSMGTLNNFSADESDFLATDFFVASGYAVHSAQWQMQTGEPGQGFSREAAFITPLNHSDTSTVAYLSTPYFLSVSVALAEPVDASIIGFSVPAELTVGGVFVSPISMTVAALSDDGKRMIVKSDFIVPIDSRDFEADALPDFVYDRWTEADDPDDPAINIFAPMFYAMDDPNHVVYDPNFIDHNNVIHNRLDPERYRPVVCVPVAEGQRLQIEFTDATISAFIPFLAENWLTSNAVVDLNGDGIVNFKDVVLFMKEFQ